LEDPLPIPEKPSVPPDAETAAPEEADAEPAAVAEAQATVLEGATAEVAASPGPDIETSEEPAPASSSAPPSEVLRVPIELPVPVDVQPDPSEGLSPLEMSSLSALGCYVSAISLDLIFIVGIVVARLFFRLPTREMYILIGLSAVLPALFLFLGRLGGGLWTRAFGWLVRRL
jgi:hypothetical protein